MVLSLEMAPENCTFYGYAHLMSHGLVSYLLRIPPCYRLYKVLHVSLLKTVYDNHAGQASPPPYIFASTTADILLHHRPYAPVTCAPFHEVLDSICEVIVFLKVLMHDVS